MPNGGFERVLISDCDEYAKPTFDLSMFLRNWYGGWHGYTHVFNSACPSFYASFREMHILPPNWRVSAPYEGDYHIQLGGSPWANGTQVSSSLGVALKQDLVKDQLYYLEVQFKNRGIRPIGDFRDCVKSPPHHLQFHFSSQTMETIIVRDSNLYFADSYVQGSEYVILDSSEIVRRSVQTPNWHKLMHCFRAQGGESHLLISAPLGRFELSPHCDTIDERFVLDEYFYEIDDVRLMEIPLDLKAEVTVCAGEADTVHLLRLISPTIFSNADFVWPDGTIDSNRVVQGEGQYDIDVVLPCTTITLSLNVIADDCATRFFIPNAFSPNGDGINDRLETFVRAFWDLNSYQFQIFDRWGSLVFASTNPVSSWDGTIDGKLAPAGSYLWTLEYELMDPRGAQFEREAGDVILIR